MATAYQPRARLICLVFLSTCLVGGFALHASPETSGPADAPEALPAPSNVQRAIDLSTPAEYEPAAVLAANEEPARVADEPAADVEALPEPEAPAIEPVADDEAQAVRVLRVCRVTAYCDRGTTAAGVPSGVGQCAAPGYIPLGSKVYIPALDQTFIVTDRTHRRFRNSTVDLFIPAKNQCRQFGCQFLECEFIIPADRAGDN